MEKVMNFEDARRLVSTPNSSCRCLTAKKRLLIPPLFLGNVKRGVARTLKKLMNQYCDVFGGVPIAYDNVKVVGHGQLHGDSPWIHVNVTADFILFQPDIGTTLNATINKIGEDFFGCLVHGQFNGSVPKHSDNADWPGNRLGLDDDVLMTVDHVDTVNAVLSIQGRLDHQWLCEKEFLADEEAADREESPSDRPNPPPDIKTEPSTKPKPRKPKKRRSEIAPDSSGAEVRGEPETPTSSKDKKKKKSRKCSKNENAENFDKNAENSGENAENFEEKAEIFEIAPDSSGTEVRREPATQTSSKDKKKKSRKRSRNENAENSDKTAEEFDSLTDFADAPASKKSKKPTPRTPKSPANDSPGGPKKIKTEQSPKIKKEIFPAQQNTITNYFDMLNFAVTRSQKGAADTNGSPYPESLSDSGIYGDESGGN